jgi:hypothetical protein
MPQPGLHFRQIRRSYNPKHCTPREPYKHVAYRMERR